MSILPSFSSLSSPSSPTSSFLYHSLPPPSLPSDTSPDFTRPDFHTDFSPASDTVLAVPPEDQPVTLTCNSNASLPYKWFKNGDEIEGQASNTYTIPQNESGLYCCEILGQNSRIIINTHCVTVFFRCEFPCNCIAF